MAAVLVDVSNQVMHFPCTTSSAGSRPSHQAVSRPGFCGRIGGTETISVQIPSNNDNTYAITVCLRGPELARAKRQVQAVFDSVSFDSS